MEMREQIEMAKRIIERDGDCNEADCKECPFGKMCDATEGENEKFAEMLRVFVEENSENEDNVNSPNHYKLAGLDVEVIDVIRASMAPAILCTAYIWRFRYRALLTLRYSSQYYFAEEI